MVEGTFVHVKAHSLPTHTLSPRIETQDLKILPVQGAEKYALFYHTGWPFTFCLDTSLIRSPPAQRLASGFRWSASSSVEPLCPPQQRQPVPCSEHPVIHKGSASSLLFFGPDIILVSLSVFTFNHGSLKMGAQNWRCFSKGRTLE